VRVPVCIGKAVALALLSVSLSNCGNPFSSDPKQVDAKELGANASADVRAFYAADYCAYPVTSSESDTLRGSIGEGLRDPNMQED